MTVILIPNTIGPVQFEATLSEKHYSDVTITDNPVEDGSTVHDHAVAQPRELVVEVAAESAAEKFEELVQFQRERETFSMVSGLTIYENMMIEGVEVDRDPRSEKILRAKVYMREIIFAQTANADIPSSLNRPAKGLGAKSPSKDSVSADRADAATATEDRGEVSPSEVDDGGGTSILKEVFT